MSKLYNRMKQEFLVIRNTRKVNKMFDKAAKSAKKPKRK